MANQADEDYFQQDTVWKDSIKSRFAISDAALSNISISEIRAVIYGKIYDVVFEFYSGKPVEDISESLISETSIPINWWHMLLDGVVPHGMRSLRGKIQYRKIQTKLQRVIKRYNVCPHINAQEAVLYHKHFQWMSSDPNRSEKLTPLLHTLRKSPRLYNKQLMEIEKLFHRSRWNADVPWEDCTNAIADLIEAALAER